LAEILESISEFDGSIFIEIKVALGSRDDLIRPKLTPRENKIHFIDYLKNK